MPDFNYAYTRPGKAEQTIELNGLTVVKFRQVREYQRKELFLSTHLLHLLLQGEKRIHHGEQVLTFKSGEAFFLKKGHYVIGEILEAELPFQNLLFFFEPSLLREFLKTYRLDPLPGPGAPNIFPVKVTPAIEGFIASILPLFESDLAADKDLLRLKFFELLFYLSHSEENRDFLNFLQALSRDESPDLVELMKVHFTEPLTVDQFAFLSNRSVSTFKREFKAVFGLPPGRWIREQRLKRACFLLARGEMNVTEVCLESGFQNLSHFIQLFKKELGQTPKQWAKNNIF